MPVTARLSNSLHRVLGDESGADFVDWMQSVDANRLELRELNELSQSRMDSRIERLEFKFEAVRHEIRADIAEFRHAVDVQIAGLRQEVGAQIAELRQEVGVQIAELRQEVGGQIAELRQESGGQIAGLRQETRAAIAELRDESRGGLAGLELRLTTKIDQRFADLIKWSFVFWIGAVAAAVLARG